MEKNKALLIENFTGFLRPKEKKYKKVYIFSGRLRHAIILPHDFLTQVEYYMSHYKAGALIDWVYERYIETTEVATFNRLMQDERAEIIIKKQVFRSVGEILLSFIMADKFIKEYGIEEDRKSVV